MKAGAYWYAEGSENHPPAELEQKWLIDQYGVEAVTGRRVLGYGEMRRMTYTENIVTYYNSRKAFVQNPDSGGYVQWETDHPGAAAILKDAMNAANELAGDGDDASEC